MRKCVSSDPQKLPLVIQDVQVAQEHVRAMDAVFVGGGGPGQMRCTLRLDHSRTEFW